MVEGMMDDMEWYEVENSPFYSEWDAAKT